MDTPMSATAGQKRVPTVLIVDDDASLRLLCRINLELDGYNVLEAPNVTAAGHGKNTWRYT